MINKHCAGINFKFSLKILCYSKYLLLHHKEMKEKKIAIYIKVFIKMYQKFLQAMIVVI